MAVHNKKEVGVLLKNIQKGFKSYSVKELNEAIISALSKKDDKKQEIDYVFEIVTKHYGISINTLKKNNARGKVQDAKQTAYCLLHYNLGLSIRYISDSIFFNWPNSVATGINRYKNSDMRVKEDKTFMEAYQVLSTELVNYMAQQHKTGKQ